MKRLAVAVATALSLSGFARAAEPTLIDVSEGELRRTAGVDVASALSLNRPDAFSTVDGAILLHSLPVLTLLDGRRFPISGDLGRMGISTVDLFPVAFLRGVDVHRGSGLIHSGSDAPAGVIDYHLKRFITGGEVGVLYGRSGGKYSREDFESYLVGGVGNEKIQITAGASYRESSGTVSHQRR